MKLTAGLIAGFMSLKLKNDWHGVLGIFLRNSLYSSTYSNLCFASKSLCIC